MAASLKVRFGARNTLIVAALVFATGTAIATMASSMPQVLAGRVLQGLGEGIIAALCYALIPELFPQRLVPKIFGAEAIVWAAAAFGGPLISGLLTEYWSWRAAFFVNIPAAAIFIALVVAILRQPKQGPRAAGPVPLLRLVAFGFGIMLISLSNTAADGYRMSALLAAALAVFVATVRFDRRSPQSILPFGAFSFDRPLGTGLWVVLLMPLAQGLGSVYLVYALHISGVSARPPPLLERPDGHILEPDGNHRRGLRSHETRIRLVWTRAVVPSASASRIGRRRRPPANTASSSSARARRSGSGLCLGNAEPAADERLDHRERGQDFGPCCRRCNPPATPIVRPFFGGGPPMRRFDEGVSAR